MEEPIKRASMPRQLVSMKCWKRSLLMCSTLYFGSIPSYGGENALVLTDAFVVESSSPRRKPSGRGSLPCHRLTDRRLFMAPAPRNKNIQLTSMPENEFSRKVQPERILKSRREFVLDLDATEPERAALAARFDLAEIRALHASVSLRPESTSRGTGIQAQGSVTAAVTQTCVRTGEAFQVDLAFPVEALIRPVRPLMSSSSFMEDIEEGKGMRESRSSQKSMRNSNSRKSSGSNSFEGLDLSELQGLLESIENEDSSLFESSSSTTLMEDEAIYSTESLLDVGELISQLFWLQLDPYPKKEGSGPVQYSITG